MGCACNTHWKLEVHIKLWSERICRSIRHDASPGGPAVKGVGLRSLHCWDCGFDSRRGHECLSLMSVVFCQVEVCASG